MPTTVRAVSDGMVKDGFGGSNMPPDTSSVREAELARIVATEQDAWTLREHIKEIVEGAAFKGSHRSGQFLKYVVDQAIAGHFECLKERIIGVELFRRSPSYDTGDDAIVRVTASDVRRRLLQHYGTYGNTSEFRIQLPLGSYVPEITRDSSHAPKGGPSESVAPHNGTGKNHSHFVAEAPAPLAVSPTRDTAMSGVLTSDVTRQRDRTKPQVLAFGLILVTINLAAWALIWSRGRSREPESASVSTLPWSAFFNSPRTTEIITSDPNIAEIQGLTDAQITVSDYANHKYIPEPNTLTSQIRQFCQIILRGDKAAAVDTPIVAGIAELAATYRRKVGVHAARDIQFSDLKNDDNFVFLGSPRSDPWSSLFAEQLDFQFMWDKKTGQEIIRNVHPKANELSLYIPTAAGWATGQSFAILGLVRNPDQDGQVLLIAGANGEGTAAAGKLATDLPRLASTLEQCGIRTSTPFQYFEVLLRLNTMAGSPSRVDVETCHVLPAPTAPAEPESSARDH
jgi:hypothetical protein